jgi:hypothetical protein
MAEILAALKALPELIKLIKSLGEAISKMDLEKDLREIQDAHDQLDNAKTFKDRMAAYRRIASIGKRL